MQQPAASTSTMRRLVPAAVAEHQEAFGAARIVRAKHLPEYLQRKYGLPGALHRPQQVRSNMHVFGPAPPRYAALHLGICTSYLGPLFPVISDLWTPGIGGLS